jgi:hypothetical protein
MNNEYWLYKERWELAWNSRGGTTWGAAMYDPMVLWRPLASRSRCPAGRRSFSAAAWVPRFAVRDLGAEDPEFSHWARPAVLDRQVECVAHRDNRL